jgi:hypothetical protein
MEPGERELRQLLRRARLALSFEEPWAPEHAAETGINRASLNAIAERAAARAVQLYADTHPRPTQVTQSRSPRCLASTRRPSETTSWRENSS